MSLQANDDTSLVYAQGRKSLEGYEVKGVGGREEKSESDTTLVRNL